MAKKLHDENTEGRGDAKRDELYTECGHYYHQSPWVLHFFKRHFLLDTPAQKSRIHKQELHLQCLLGMKCRSFNII